MGLLNEPFAPYGEITNHLPQLEDTFSKYGVHPSKKFTCSQETENSCVSDTFLYTSIFFGSISWLGHILIM